MKRGIFLRFSILSLALTALLLTYFYFFQFLPSQAALLKNNLADKIKIVSALSMPTFADALRSRDDIALLSEIDRIMKIEDIAAAYVLDGAGKVLVHNKTDEWGKLYSDALTLAALSSKKPRFHDGDDAMLYSMPVLSSATLCLSVSLQRVNETYAAMKKAAVYNAAAALVIAGALFMGFGYRSIKTPFALLQKKLASVINGTARNIEAPARADSEFDALERSINEALTKTAGRQNQPTPSADSDKRLAQFIQVLLATCDYGVGVINADNKVLYLNDVAREFLGIKAEYFGGHILDVIQDNAVIDILRLSSDTDTPVQATINNKTVQAVKIINNPPDITGTVLTIK